MTNLTHYERVTGNFKRHDAEGRRMAKDLMTADREELGKKFGDYIRKRKDKLPDKPKSKRSLVKLLIPLSESSLATCHYVTRELLRKQKDPCSFKELTTHPSFAALIGLTIMDTNEVVVTSAGHMHFHMAAHAETGKIVYEATPGLGEQLRHTELRGLDVDDLKLPHRSVYLKVPHTADLKIWNDFSQWHDVEGIYITEEFTEGTRCWRFLVCGESKPIQVYDGVIDDNDALVYFSVPLPAGMKLDEALATTQEEVIHDVEKLRLKGKDSFGPMVYEWQSIFRWAMNLILYMSTEDSEKEEVISNKEARQLHERIQKLPNGSKKKANLQRKYSGIQTRHRIILGKSVTTNRGSWELTVRVRVVGHWRNQPYGPGRTLRRLQWIEPHWRGPDGELARAATEVAPNLQKEPGGTDEPGNRESDPTFGRVATLPTEGVVSGDQLLNETSERSA